MLLQFSVKNFRSFANEETLRLYAGKGAELLDTNTFAAQHQQRLVCSSVIYGANASGKSNLIKALYFLQQFILLSSTAFQEKQKIPLQPFRLHSSAQEQPSEFSIDFMCSGIRFTYCVALTEEQVITEELYAYPKKYRQTWFTRKWNHSLKKYDWYHGPSFKGEHKAWAHMTRLNALYLSTAVQFNSELLQPIFLWFKERLVILVKDGLQENVFHPELTLQFLKNPQTLPWIRKFIECADIGIEDFQVIEETSPLKKTIIKTQHQMIDSEQKIFFDLLQDESAGTQRLFLLIGGWLQALREGLVLCVDELDLHLHPYIVRYLIELFHTPKVNQNKAQLIFTTHDTSLLDSDIFRRDQIWFVQKDEHLASRLSSLLDFKPRKGEAIGKGYLKGRYGALPFLGKFRF